MAGLRCYNVSRKVRGDDILRLVLLGEGGRVRDNALPCPRAVQRMRSSEGMFVARRGALDY
jgi:hypothetical protein